MQLAPDTEEELAELFKGVLALFQLRFSLPFISVCLAWLRINLNRSVSLNRRKVDKFAYVWQHVCAGNTFLQSDASLKKCVPERLMNGKQR